MAEDKKAVTVRDLQTFIEAVEFAADVDDWVPSERQWRRIREMINNLVDSQPQPALNKVAAGIPRADAQPATYAPPSLPVRMAPGSLPPPTPVSGQPAPFASGSATPAKTPDIDTSSGGYQSGFA